MENKPSPVAEVGESSKPIRRSEWKRSLIELTGRLVRNHRHDLTPLLMQSYSQIGTFHHTYQFLGEPCKTQITNFNSHPRANVIVGRSTAILVPRPVGISAMEFDSKGTYLASVTRSGCFTVHEFESLYCQEPEENEGKLLHVSFPMCLDGVRWNPADNREVAFTSLANNEVRICDIGNIVSPNPVEVLRERPKVTLPSGCGVSDMAFLEDNTSVVLASDTSIYGAISIWDRRVSVLPQIELTANANGSLSSIQLSGDQCVYGATNSGFIHIWDLRAGRSASVSQSHSEVHYSPITSVNLASKLDEMKHLKEIQSIDINPSCPHQLGFNLACGWAGVFDVHNFQVTHIHCLPLSPPHCLPLSPPPAFLEDRNVFVAALSTRKQSWLPEQSIYAVGSSSSNGIHLVDFYPHTNSPCHVDHDNSNSPQDAIHHKQNRFLPLSVRVSACATHPLNCTIVAGTEEASLLIVSQKQYCKKGVDVDADFDP